jgi:hypothetical protein
MNMCVVITVATVVLLRDFGPYIFYRHIGCDHLLLRDFGPYWIILIKVYVITVAMVKPLRYLGSYGIIFTTTSVYYFRISPSFLTEDFIAHNGTHSYDQSIEDGTNKSFLHSLQIKGKSVCLEQIASPP